MRAAKRFLLISVGLNAVSACGDVKERAPTDVVAAVQPHLAPATDREIRDYIRGRHLVPGMSEARNREHEAVARCRHAPDDSSNVRHMCTMLIISRWRWTRSGTARRDHPILQWFPEVAYLTDA